MRLSVFLAKASIASRRGADKLIAEGQVTINGEVTTNPATRVCIGKDHVKVNGKLVHKLAPTVYLKLNKPPGYVTTSNDPQGRPTVFDLLVRVKVMVEPVGRLDFDSEGLLLFTNDGDLTNRLIRPASKVPKIYKVKVSGHPSPGSEKMLREGMSLDGKKTLPAKVKRIRRTDNYTWYRMTIVEGKNRQVRRMFEKIRHRVVSLRRENFGPIELEDLKPGRFCYLRQDEVDRLRKAVT